MLTVDPLHEIKYTSENMPAFEAIKVEPSTRDDGLPEELRSRIAVGTIHDGPLIPEHFLQEPRVKEQVDSGKLWRHYVMERDWGANLVAKHLAQFLGLDSFGRVNVARVVMDYNRFPGSSPRNAGHFERLAISPPLSDVLSYQQKRDVLERCYDRISSAMERRIQGKQLMVTIHTYDPHNWSLTKRPEVSIISSSHSYQLNSHLPFGLYDPLFPDDLVSSCVDPILRDRIALTVQKMGTYVEHNYPYCFPDGSLEIRAQVWLFFQYVRRLFLERHPHREGRPSYDRVWEMLFNTSQRKAESEVLFSYLHRYRRPSHGAGLEMAAARKAYKRIWEFVQEERLGERYRQSPDRVSTFGIEVRKDLIWNFDGDNPLEPNEAAARDIAEKIAEGIITYYLHDRA